MNPSYYRISLDIHDATSQLSFSIKRGDTNRRLLISLMDNGVPYAITQDCYAVFSARKPDGNLIHNDCTIKGNMIIYDVTSETTVLEGRLNCEITLYGINSETLTSPRFTIIVYDTVFTETEVVSSPEITSLTALISASTTVIQDCNEATNACESATSRCNQAVAEGYDSVNTRMTELAEAIDKKQAQLYRHHINAYFKKSSAVNVTYIDNSPTPVSSVVDLDNLMLYGKICTRSGLTNGEEVHFSEVVPFGYIQVTIIASNGAVTHNFYAITSVTDTVETL